MKDMNKNSQKLKGMGLTLATGALGLGVAATPVSVFAKGITKASDEANPYGFVYKRNENEAHTGGSVYALELKKGIDKKGKEFDVNEKQIKEASVIFQSGEGEARAQVNHDGLYDFVNIQREPGFYPRKEASMITTENGLFEFPRVDWEGKEHGHDVQAVEIKEHQLKEKLELILRNPKNVGLAGDFEIKKIAEPAKVNGEYFENPFFDEEKAKNNGYNKPGSASEAHRVTEWKEVSEDFGKFKINSDKSVAWKVDEPNKEVHYAERLEKDIEEGIYTISQTASEVGYLKRAEDVKFIVTLDENAEPVLLFEGEKGFNQLHDLEYFKYGTYEGGEATDSLYQTLLVNFPIPGVTPIDPVDPVDPDDPDKPGDRDPNKPGYENAFDKKGVRTEGRKAELSEEKVYPEGEDVLVGNHIKVNIGEEFGLSFDMRIPENFENYNYIHFVDPLDENIERVDDQDIFVKLGDEDISDLVTSELLVADGKKCISVKFEPDKMNDRAKELSGKDVKIEVSGLYLNKTREDVKNRAYLYYQTKDGQGVQTPDDPTEHPNPKDVIDPENPGNPLDPDNPDETDPKIPTTPEITIDPITVDFRMGVVDSGTTLLKDATYEILEFTPSRGEGGIDDNGNLRIGEVEFDINKFINDGAVTEDGFVKLADLPAGRYRMVERTAPKGKDNGEQYRLVTHELVFHVNEDEQRVFIESPIVKNGKELTGDVINVEELYRKEKGSPERNEDNWNKIEVLEGEAMLHHYRYINTPETGTLAGIPFFLGGGALVSAGVIINKKKKED